MDRLMETYFSLEVGFADIDNSTAIESSEFVYLLGNCFCSKNIDEIKKFTTSRIWFTYRKNFPAIGGTGPTTDQGWGCMLRCGQMLLSQALWILKLGRTWEWEKNSKNLDYRRLLRMFQDKRTSLYSIHQISQMGVSEGKALGEWFGPNTIAQVLKKLVIYDDWARIAIHVAMDNILISSDVKAMARAKPPCKDLNIGEKTKLESDSTKTEGDDSFWRPLLIIIPLRLGLTTINRCYLPAIEEYFKLPQCIGIIGGRPNHAVYFYGIAKDKLLYLDPHVCQESVSLETNQLEVINSEQQSGISSYQSNASMEMVDNPANSVRSNTSSPETTKEDDCDNNQVETEEVTDSSFHLGSPISETNSDDNFDDSTFHCPYLMHMDFDSLDPSLALSFLCSCEDDYIDLLERLKPMINASKPPLFDLLETRPKGFPKFIPYLGDDEALKLKEFDDFGDPTFNSDEEFEVLMP